MIQSPVAGATVLVVEDDDSTAELARRALVRTRRVVRGARRVDEALKLIANERFGVAILDFRLEDGDAWPILAAAHAVSPPLPVILVTAMGDEVLAAEALRRGAADYLIKSGSFWEQLPEIVDRVARASEAANENALLASLVRHTDDAILAGSIDGIVRSWNPGAERLFGYGAKQIIGSSSARLFPEDRVHEIEDTVERLRRGEPVVRRETQRRRADGSLVDVSESVSPIHNAAGATIGVAVVVRDITERKSLQAQLQHAQKMEAVGRLAGGVAHDFNNLLTVINGYAEMMLAGVDARDPAHGQLSEISGAGRRAAALTRQLLAFSRQQVFAAKALDLNSIVLAMQTLLRRLIGEDVQLETNLAPVLGLVLADTGQIEQVLANLVVNARDAMPKGGRIVIETDEVELDSAYIARHVEAIPGPHVRLSVRDTGVGMDPQTAVRIFEPFFTTKPRGEGTGLGLSIVHGIVRQAGGHLRVESEPGRGTTFTIYLPRTAVGPTIDAPPRREGVARGTETILVAEDDDAIRVLVTRVLEGAGYTVITANDGTDAAVIAANHRGPIHLLLTDMVMRTMGGLELSEHALASRPGLRVLYMSGYTSDTVARQGRMAAGAAFLQKPFVPDVLRRKVREVLDAPPAR